MNISITISNNIYKIGYPFDLEFDSCFEYAYDNKYHYTLFLDEKKHNYDYLFKKDNKIIAKLVYNLDGYYILIKSHPLLANIDIDSSSMQKINTNGIVIEINASDLYSVHVVDLLISKLYELQLMKFKYPWD